MQAKKVWIVVQEGGSSNEHYASGYDTKSRRSTAAYGNSGEATSRRTA